MRSYRAAQENHRHGRVECEKLLVYLIAALGIGIDRSDDLQYMMMVRDSCVNGKLEWIQWKGYSLGRQNDRLLQ